MIISTPVCLFLAVGLVAPVESVAVEVDASSVDTYGPGISHQLGGRVSAALTEQGIVVDDASKNRLRIEVREPSPRSYDVTFVLEVDGTLVEPGLEHVTCERCRLVSMDEKVLAKLPEALALMEQASEPEPAAQVPPPEEPEVTEHADEPSEPAQEGPEQPPK